jgi:hypothetical protein
MGQQPAAGVDALGDSVYQAAAEFQHFGGAAKPLVFEAGQEIGFHFHSHGGIVDAQFGFDRQPHGDVGRGHVYLAAYDASGALERRLEGHIDAAFAISDAVEREAEVSREGDTREQLRQFVFGACEVSLHLKQFWQAGAKSASVRHWIQEWAHNQATPLHD